MIYLAPHLHAYQPPTQRKEILNRIYGECYEPLIALAERQPGVYFSMDLAKSLGEHLPEEFLQRIKNLHAKGTIELVNTAAYHYLLPLVPKEIAARQLKLNTEFYYKNFETTSFIGCGVFPPELAFSPSSIPAIKECGALWTMADDEFFNRENFNSDDPRRVPQNYVPVINGLGILLRSRHWSNLIAHGRYDTGKQVLNDIIVSQNQWGKKCSITGDTYLIIAMDMETFGHWHNDGIERFILPFFEESAGRYGELRVVFPDHIYQRFPKKFLSADFLSASSWSTDDISIPFPLWNHPQNEFHRLWNDFTNTVFRIAPQNPEKELQKLLDEFAYSCTPWQYSQGNKEVASWCLPHFLRITELIHDGPEKTRLKKIYDRMSELLKY